MSADKLQRAVAMAQLLLAARERVHECELQLEAAKADARRIEQVDLPDLMQELGIDKFRLANGASVEVRPEVDAAITEARRAEAHAWLVGNGFGGLIKTEVVVSFERGAIDAAQQCAEDTGGALVERVHPSTLRSFVKEQMAAGKPVPFDLFGVHPYHKVKITAPKA